MLNNGTLWTDGTPSLGEVLMMIGDAAPDSLQVGTATFLGDAA
jgi:hypothetical protein